MTPRRSVAPAGDSSDSSPIRLQKFLASAGLGSRRHCEEFIETGRVSIDGDVVVDLGTRVDPTDQKVRVDGELVRAQPQRYYLLNKPPGYVCTNRDPAGRQCAIDLVRDSSLRLFTVGRLDENSRGLLLVTNDGKLANRLAHPRYQVRRQYQVQVAGIPTQQTIKQLKQGVRFSDGIFRVQGIKRLKSKGKSSFLEIVITEGQNREIRRLFARAGHKVMKLQRVGFGPLKLGRLAEGKFRPLSDREVNSLKGLLDHSPTKTKPTAGDRSQRKRTSKKGAAKKRPAKQLSQRKQPKKKRSPPKRPSGKRPAKRRSTKK